MDYVFSNSKAGGKKWLDPSWKTLHSMPRKIRKRKWGRTDVASENLHIMCGHKFVDLQPKKNFSLITASLSFPICWPLVFRPLSGFRLACSVADLFVWIYNWWILTLKQNKLFDFTLLSGSGINTTHITRGIPQGSGLGPVLISICILLL